MKSTNERLDKLSTEMAELTTILEHTQDQLEDEMKTIKARTIPPAQELLFAD